MPLYAVYNFFKQLQIKAESFYDRVGSVRKEWSLQPRNSLRALPSPGSHIDYSLKANRKQRAAH